MPAANLTPPSESANRRWKRLMPLLLVLVGFGAGVLASHLAPSVRRHRGASGEHRMGTRDDSDRRSGRRPGEGAEQGRSRSREAREGEERSRRFREQLARRLGLDEDQQARMEAFIESNRAEASEFWDDTYARYRELRLRFREQIREILNESQRQTFDAWMRERGRNDGSPDSVEDSAEGATPGGRAR